MTTMATTKLRLTQGDMAIEWIEDYCRYPSGLHKGDRVRLCSADMHTVRCIYDAPDGPPDQRLTGDLAAYLALYHCICGPPAGGKSPPPCPVVLDANPWTIWAAADHPSPRRVLKREPAAVACPALGTRFPRAAA
jgi:hypothetical protein